MLAKTQNSYPYVPVETQNTYPYPHYPGVVFFQKIDTHFYGFCYKNTPSFQNFDKETHVGTFFFVKNRTCVWGFLFIWMACRHIPNIKKYPQGEGDYHYKALSMLSIHYVCFHVSNLSC